LRTAAACWSVDSGVRVLVGRLGRPRAGRSTRASARYPAVPGARALVDLFRRRSPDLAELWDHVESGFHHQKTMQHPVVGTPQLNCDTLAVPLLDHYLVCLIAGNGPRSADALRLLPVVGTQGTTIPASSDPSRCGWPQFGPASVVSAHIDTCRRGLDT